MKHLLLSSLIFLFLISGCKEDSVSPPEIKDSNFSSPEEYIQNPSVNNAVQNSGININNGNNPPPLAGDYNAVGEVTDASASIKALIVGKKINSLITLFNQTNSGKIDFREKVGNVTAWASGGYITGDNGKFTIWQESKQSGKEAGLPEGITIYVALLMSGTKLSNGDLQAKGVSVVTKAESNNSNYDVTKVIGVWWMWEADFTLIGPPSGKPTSNNDLTEIYNHAINFSLSRILNNSK